MYIHIYTYTYVNHTYWCSTLPAGMVESVHHQGTQWHYPVAILSHPKSATPFRTCDPSARLIWSGQSGESETAPPQNVQDCMGYPIVPNAVSCCSLEWFSSRYLQIGPGQGGIGYPTGAPQSCPWALALCNSAADVQKKAEMSALSLLAVGRHTCRFESSVLRPLGGCPGSQIHPDESIITNSNSNNVLAINNNDDNNDSNNNTSNRNSNSDSNSNSNSNN